MEPQECKMWLNVEKYGESMYKHLEMVPLSASERSCFWRYAPFLRMQFYPHIAILGQRRGARSACRRQRLPGPDAPSAAALGCPDLSLHRKVTLLWHGDKGVLYSQRSASIQSQLNFMPEIKGTAGRETIT
ncbi:hypothetical protein Pelo_822 [Pelomyxa schiedti]|nr:hypothetical protein Pelo_822 [Pelomyxa schiedti]